MFESRDEPARQLVIYRSDFFDFYREQSPVVRKKMDFVLELIKWKSHIPSKFFRRIVGTEGLWEIRIAYNSNQYRILCFFDRQQTLVLLNAFQKKEQKTPRKEIEKARRLMHAYFSQLTRK